ncbi:MAG: long-chain fatty acid--CoA ligase [Bacteroidetes bacterium]|nr:MAG: long-chain fatty acid--CoA ligase [Bacteroidota bacterium]
MMKEKLVDLIQDSIRKNWDNKAMTNYGGDSITYSDMAKKIIHLHTLFEECKVQKGDKVALVGKNSINWTAVYLASVTYGAVVVPILPDFKPNDIHHIVNHSDSIMLFAADNIYENLESNQMLDVKVTFSLNDFSLLYVDNSLKAETLMSAINVGFQKKLENLTGAAVFQLPSVGNESLAVFSYTSGTTGFTKGVMITHNNLVANLIYANNNMPLRPGDDIVCFLPLAHAYGCAFEFLWPFTIGAHITFLTKTPSPQIILKAFKEIRPRLILAVPLIMEKIYKKQILPALGKSSIKLMLKLPLLSTVIENKIKKKLTDSFGGNFHEIVIGGAPLSSEVEDFLHRIKFPFSIGYGMTECAPLISYASWDKTKLRSAGKPVDSLEIKIDSPDPYNEAGEILLRGENIMQGYYKNPEATRAALEPDGWMHTGDLGLIDRDNFVYIKGRSKSMILGPSGQNIYPEEIEARYNNLPFVQESLVTEKDNKLIILIYPDHENADKEGLNDEDLKKVFEEHRRFLNQNMPTYMGVSAVRIFSEEFEKTPKKSIKRFLYTNV